MLKYMMWVLKLRIYDKHKSQLVNFVCNFVSELGFKYPQRHGKFLSAYDLNNRTKGGHVKLGVPNYPFTATKLAKSGQSLCPATSANACLCILLLALVSQLGHAQFLTNNGRLSNLWWQCEQILPLANNWLTLMIFVLFALWVSRVTNWPQPTS